MKLILVKSFWGMEGTTAENMRRIADAGFAAVEGRPAGVGADRETFMALCREHQLAYIPMVLTEAPGETVAGHLAQGDSVAGHLAQGDSVAGHLEDFRRKVDEALMYEPLQITAHCGRDCWTFEQQKEFFAAALDIERRCGVAINHETHRSRVMFTPWATAALLREFPELHINADFSHFVNVCERLPVDQADNLALCVARTRHLHGRVGHEQGPQVNDPRAPEWAAQLAWHEAQWDEMVRARHRAGAAYFTFNPEFGPPGYMPTLPWTMRPVGDLWEICVYMAGRFRERYATLVA